MEHGLPHLVDRAGKRRAAGQQFVQDGAGRPDVGPAVARPVGELLGRHVVEGPLRQVPLQSIGGPGPSRIRRSRQREVEQLQAPRREEHARGAEGAVHQAAVVEHLEGAQQVEQNRHGVADGQCASRQARRQGLPFQQLHREVHLAVGFADLVHLADAGMAHAGRYACFSEQPLSLAEVTPLAAQRLEGDGAAQACILGRVDRALSAFAQAAEQPVGTQPVLHEEVRLLYLITILDWVLQEWRRRRRSMDGARPMLMREPSARSRQILSIASSDTSSRRWPSDQSRTRSATWSSPARKGRSRCRSTSAINLSEPNSCSDASSASMTPSV